MSGYFDEEPENPAARSEEPAPDDEDPADEDAAADDAAYEDTAYENTAYDDPFDDDAADEEPADVVAVAEVIMISAGRAVEKDAAGLYYTAADPFAVSLIAPLGPASEGYHVTWVFARALLDEGTRVPAGEGDVRIWPAGAGGTVVELHGDDKALLAIRFETADLRRFLARSYNVVEAGCETVGHDLDKELVKLLRSH
jgi:Streptomyces sporulation and cell division protein, SsgA